MNEIKEFKEWLAKNQESLKYRNLDEIQQMALACGFSPILVTQWKHHEMFKAARQ